MNALLAQMVTLAANSRGVAPTQIVRPSMAVAPEKCETEMAEQHSGHDTNPWILGSH